MQARLFGGKSTFLHNTDIGVENARVAKRFLIENGTRLVGSDLGGEVARWVTFNPTTGETNLPKSENNTEQVLTMRR
ncbi:hypothetical protein [Rhizobium sp. MHM7A]|uniref:hypothetical protein n=1 Tax=Rhizobium sp. MHM7A TaxID=2583233 RepID=UPI001105960F|nr:hypothetical protein [Rhizobium sp. MHM7A]TLX16209.1 hypothetical protein FFR93_02460 [Rhizobium sp. MHM7A]